MQLFFKYKLILLCLSLTILSQSQATSYRHLSIGEYIDHSELIVIGNTFKNNKDSYVKITKVIKGDKKYLHKTISLTNNHYKNPSNIITIGSYKFPPLNKNNIAIFFHENWQVAPVDFMFLHYFSEPQEIRALKKIHEVLKIKDEAKRFTKLIKLYNKNIPFVKEQFLKELMKMKNPETYNMVLGFIEQQFLHYEQKAKIKRYDKQKLLDLEYHLVDLLEKTVDIGDSRIIPLMIKMLSSSSKDLRVLAADSLYSTFSGADGVTDAFIKYDHIPGVHWYSSKYLKKRFTNYVDLNPQKPHPWYLANQFEKENNFEAAKLLYNNLLSNTQTSNSDKIYTAKKYLNIANKQDKVIILNHILPVIENEITKQYSGQIKEYVEILRKLNHQDCLPLLLKILSYSTNNSFDHPLKETVYAIKELGIEAQKQAQNLVKQKFKNRSKGDIHTDTDLIFAIAYSWLKTDDSIQFFQDSFHQYFLDKFKPIILINQQSDQVAFLTNLLNSSSKLHPEILEWTIYSLGESRDIRAIKPIIDQLIISSGYIDYNFYKNVLSSFNKNEISKVMKGLFTHKNEFIKKLAIDIYVEIEKEKSIVEIRRMFNEQGYGSKQSAYTYLYYYGTPEDWPLLKKQCNFWNQQDYTYQYTHDSSCHALLGIQDRYNYDINGPIKKYDEPYINEK